MLYLHLHVKNHDMSRQGPLKMDGTLPKISNLKLQGRGGGGGSNTTLGLGGGRWHGLRS